MIRGDIWQNIYFIALIYFDCFIYNEYCTYHCRMVLSFKELKGSFPDLRANLVAELKRVLPNFISQSQGLEQL